MKASIYAWRLYFTREFTSGNLIGLTHQDHIDFVKVDDCLEWLRCVREREDIDYKIVDFKLDQLF